MATVAIHHPQDPTRPKVIPESHYDSTRHELWGSRSEAPATEEAEPAITSLPDDFPGKGPLEAADIVTIHEVRGLDDLTAIDGIGDTTAESIASYLDDLEE